MLPAWWALTLSWEFHVGLVCLKALRRVVARWEMDIGSEGGSITIAVLVREADTSASISWVLDSSSIEAVRVHRV